MNMKSVIILINFCLLLSVLIAPASASYAGDKPLQTVLHDKHQGDLYFSLGDSRYSGELACNDSYVTNFNIEIPAGSSVKTARAYVYWVWSKKGLDGIYPEFEISLVNSDTAIPITGEQRYTDTKGFASRYDFFSGVDAYDLTGNISESGSYSISLMNAAEDERTFCVQGIGLLLVYEGSDLPTIEYWVNEGCDMLYAEYGIEPEMATMTTSFEGEIDPEQMVNAQLITVSPSGGYSSGTGTRSKLFFNENTKKIPVLGDIIQLLFGTGKSWKNIYTTNDTVQIAVDRRLVSSYIESNGNFASIQDNGDYLLATNAILVVEYKESEQEA